MRNTEKKSNSRRNKRNRRITETQFQSRNSRPRMEGKHYITITRYWLRTRHSTLKNIATFKEKSLNGHWVNFETPVDTIIAIAGSKSL